MPRLGERPLHTDESINAYITGELLAGKAYQYDPKDRHGPALYALALPIAELAGAKSFAELTESSLRMGPVVVGALTILLFAFLVDLVGMPAAAFGALLFAVAPLSVYYSRDFIHETLFVAATLAAILFGVRLLEKKSMRDAILAGASGGLMLACKETAVIHFAAFGVVALGWVWWMRSSDSSSPDWRSFLKPALAGFISFCVVMIVLFTWGGRHWGGLMDLFRAGPHLVSRAGGEGHQKPDWYYLALLAGGWSGVMVLALAIWGAFRYPYKTAGNKAFGAVVIYTIAIIFLYSVIPYKTPWLALNFFLPLCLLAGNGLAELGRISRSPGGRMAVVFFAAALCAALGRDTWQRVFAAPADEHNPYAYAQTDEDFLRLPKLIQQLAENTPARRNLRIAVVAADAWPLPWYLRRFPNTGFWQPGQDPGGADIYITSSEVPDDLNARLKNWRPEFFGVRPEVLMVVWRPPESEPPHE